MPSEIEAMHRQALQSASDLLAGRLDAAFQAIRNLDRRLEQLERLLPTNCKCDGADHVRTTDCGAI